MHGLQVFTSKCGMKVSRTSVTGIINSLTCDSNGLDIYVYMHVYGCMLCIYLFILVYMHILCDNSNFTEILYTCAVTKCVQGDVTFTPRLVALDLRGSLSSLRKDGTLYSTGREEEVKW